MSRRCRSEGSRLMYAYIHTHIHTHTLIRGVLSCGINERLLTEHCLHRIERKPRDEWPDARNEDLLKCFKCFKWLPSYFYTHGLAGPDADIETLQEYKNIGHIWACNNCFVTSGLFACKPDGSTTLTSRFLSPK